MMFVNGRINRRRYLAYHGFANTCLGLLAIIFAFVIPNYKDSGIIGILSVMAIPIFALYSALVAQQKNK